MNTPELSFECSVYESKGENLWIGRCEELKICTQGENEQDAMMAVAEAIWLRLTAPQRRRKRASAKAKRVITLTQVMEVGVAASTSTTSA